MATAKKCDICGVLYELYNTRNDMKNVNGIMFLNIDAERKYFSHKAIDCCPTCIQSIENHIKTLKEKEND